MREDKRSEDKRSDDKDVPFTVSVLPVPAGPAGAPPKYIPSACIGQGKGHELGARVRLGFRV
jgi:hypothetical protein